MKFLRIILYINFALLAGLLNVFAQEIPPMQDEVEFVNVDPHYSRSLRLEFGLMEPFQNKALSHFFSGLYYVKAGYVFNLKKNYLLGAYVGNFAVQNSLHDSALYTAVKEQVRNNNYIGGLQFGYEFYTSDKAVLSFLLNGGANWMSFSRKKVSNKELLYSYEKNALNVGITTSWTYFIEEKYTCGAFLSYQWFNYIYDPSWLGYATQHQSVQTQMISFGLAFNFGGGD